MKYSILGKTGLKVSKISLGGIPLQQLNQEDANKLIEKALECGINFIDTARGYTISESLIGEALPGKRQQVFLATKSMTRDKEGFKRDIEISLNNLKTDYIDLYQFHNIPNLQEFEKVMAKGGALEAMLEYKDKGIINNIGITGHYLEVLEKAIEYDVFDTIQYPYNAVETQGSELFIKAHEKNLGVIAMKPLAGGAISNTKAALKFILQNQNISCAIPGMCSIEQLTDNVKAIDEMPLSKEEMEALSKEASELGEHFCRRCGYCKPCPKGIDIPSVFVLEGYWNRYNLMEWAKDRYDSQTSKAGDCEKCGLCETKCPYNLPIRDMLESVKDTFGY
ncbi:MAG: aldo/keto reductase [Clostridiaceae bacterium]|nr:aldo/keto reductase [Clostridiaceae bacterium]